eukprot:GHVP01025920.1.p1 GENE.GHVP01025920.1~~GHVP01025920.1.p1  ORF type:complete len:144 (+),score=8.80 GHVP01025920.1:176-607(+)
MKDEEDRATYILPKWEEIKHLFKAETCFIVKNLFSLTKSCGMFGCATAATQISRTQASITPSKNPATQKIVGNLLLLGVMIVRKRKSMTFPFRFTMRLNALLARGTENCLFNHPIRMTLKTQQTVIWPSLKKKSSGTFGEQNT